MKRYPRVLTIAGSDSGGGAGIQADIKAISATGSYAASAVTAVTVQNTLGVKAVHNVPSDIVLGQIEAVLGDIGADAVKVGMLGTAANVEAVCSALRRFSVKKIVLDPVMVATSGDSLIEKSAVEMLVGQLAPLATVITPNIPEAEVILEEGLHSRDDLPRFARSISEKLSGQDGRRVSVYMKAGHLDADMLTDIFYNAEEGRFVELSSPCVRTANTHGTGCTLSSAIASYLAQGYGLDESAGLAKNYLEKALVSGAGYEIGRGRGPVNHFWLLKKNKLTLEDVS